MKRCGNLWPQVISFGNLLRAAEKARKGKRFRPNVAEFHFHLERELWALHEQLSTKTYRPGAYRTFYICEPKPRQISVAPYRDRVVHHALVNVLESIYYPDKYDIHVGRLS
jgi:retron-type reverse transcriptase